MASIRGEAIYGSVLRRIEMKITLVKSIAVQHQPAQYRIELANEFLYAPT